MARKKKIVRRTLEEIGRGVIAKKKEANVEAASGFQIGQTIQYYSKGWRYGHVAAIPSKGLRLGMIQVTHPVTGNEWVNGTDVKGVSDGHVFDLR